MAKKDSIKALVKRGVEEKVAEKLVKAGHTITSLQTAKPEDLKKIVDSDMAKTILSTVQKKAAKKRCGSNQFTSRSDGSAKGDCRRRPPNPYGRRICRG